MKCKIKMTDKIEPVEGSVKASTSGGGTGTCPECDTPGVLLSIVGGYVRAHTVSQVPLPENDPQPATMAAKTSKKVGTGLPEPQVDLTDTGLRTGDPRAAGQRRVAEIETAAGRGVVQLPRKVEGTGTTKSGKPRMVTKMVDFPATEENMREALTYWQNRKVTSDASRKRQGDMIAELTRRLGVLSSVKAPRYVKKSGYVTERKPVTSLVVESLTGTGEGVRVDATAQHAAQVVDAAQGHRGPTLVQGRSTAPRLRDPELPFTEATDLRRDGSVRKSTTLEQPRGRDRFDKMITDVPEPPRKRTASERRRYRQKQAIARLLASQGK